MRVICPTHLLHLITLTIFDEVSNHEAPPLCNVLQPPATSSVLGRGIEVFSCLVIVEALQWSGPPRKESYRHLV